MHFDESTDSLDQIRDLKRAHDSLNNVKADLEAQLKAINDKLRVITEQNLPMLMEAADLDKLDFNDGSTLRLQTFYNGKITNEEAMDWLVENNCDGIIKTEVIAKFNRGERDLATKALEAIAHLGYSVELKEGVHHQTLQAFLREQCEENPDFPRELFNVFEGKRAVFK